MRTPISGRVFGLRALAFGVLFVALPARAQDETVSEDEELILPDLVVTATRVPTAVEDLGGGIDVLKLDELLLPQAGLAEILQDLPGIDVQAGAFFGEKPVINSRGLQGQFGTQRTLILMDGIPLNDGFLGDADLRLLGMAMIDRVEVVRGPGSALYGKSALGGVVNLISRRGRETPVTEVSTLEGDYGTHGMMLGHGARVGAFDYFLSAETLSTDGYIENIDGTPRDWKGWSIGTRLGWALGEAGELGLFAQFSTGKGEREMYVEDAEHGTYWISYRHESPASPGSVFTAQAYANVTDQELAWKFGFTGLYDQMTSGLQLQQEIKAGAGHSVAFGADVRADDVEVDEAAGPVVADSTVSAAYVQDRIELEGGWNLTLGARLDYEDNFGGEVSPRLGVVRKLEEGDKLYASVGKGYRAPSASDLFLPPTTYGPFTYEGNPDLAPERHWSFEVGGSHGLGEGARLGWSAFYDLGIDAWDYMQDPDTIFRPHNVTELQTVGVELQANVRLGEGLALEAAYTFVHPTYNKYVPDPTIEGNLVEDVPGHSGSVTLAKRWPEGLAVEVVGRFTGPRFTDPENTSAKELDGFSLMDAGLTVPLGKGVSFNVKVMNVFDVDYALGLLATGDPLPQPGRSVYGGIQARF